MCLEEIQELDAISILQPTIFAELLDMESEVDRLEHTEMLQARAKQLGVLTAFKRRLAAYKKDNQKVNKYVPQIQAEFELEYTEKGAVANTTTNYVAILRNDSRFKGKLKLNELSGMPEKLSKGKLEPWTEIDDSKTRCYIEGKYGIHNKDKLFDAFNIIFNENKYNPVKDIIESVEWDGKSRIYTLLHKWLGVEDDEYSKEVSRLIFAGGIHRLYNPGCKFDDMPVLIGTKQGEGKSTFVSWLALKEEFFREVKEIEGQKGIEVLQGAWICEMSELLALTKAKEVEAVKSYITCRVDTYRKPYERRPTQNPRSCIFIGTTNKPEFLTDKTGNRRYYPVEVNCSGYDLFDNQKEVKADILQCWAEAKALYDKGELHPYANKKLLDVIRERQQAAVEDDYRVGLIQDYLERKKITSTCILQVWVEALGNPEHIKPSRKDSCDIAAILNKIDGWKKAKKPKRFEVYGLQKYWELDQLPF